MHTCTFTDACYILSFAIIMLNTSLHNPNVKHKVREMTIYPVVLSQCHHLHHTHTHTTPNTPLQPTVEQFISMNRDINDGKDLPVDMLRVSDPVLIMSLTMYMYMCTTTEVVHLWGITIRVCVCVCVCACTQCMCMCVV